MWGGGPRQQHLHLSFRGVGGARDGELRQGAVGPGRLVHDEHLTTQEEEWRVRGHPGAEVRVRGHQEAEVRFTVRGHPEAEVRFKL